MAAHQKYQFHTWLEPIGGAVESLLIFLVFEYFKTIPHLRQVV